MTIFLIIPPPDKPDLFDKLLDNRPEGSYYKSDELGFILMQVFQNDSINVLESAFSDNANAYAGENVTPYIAVNASWIGGTVAAETWSWTDSYDERKKKVDSREGTQDADK